MPRRKALSEDVEPPDEGPSTSGTRKVKKPRKTVKETPEKRMARYVANPSKAVMERIERAFQHRLYLIHKKMIGADADAPTGCEFFVLGATGNVYTVKLQMKPSCSCPDAARGNTCKHVLFVMLRVLKLPQTDPRVWQKALLSSELDDLLHISAINEGVLASQLVRQRFNEITGQASKEGSDAAAERGLQRDIDGDCPICYEKMSGGGGKPSEAIVFCMACGNNVHRDCFDRWSRSKRGSGAKVTCIYCRAVWQDNTKKKDKNVEAGPGGYVNLASYSENHGAEETGLEALYPNTWEWFSPGGSRRGRSRS